MVFWASLPPCPNEYSEADRNWRERNVVSAVSGVARTKDQETTSTNRSARAKPINGDATMASRVGARPLHTTTLKPAFEMAAPNIPPIRAWEELDGIPPSQVMTFQQIAPINAPNTTCASIT